MKATMWVIVALLFLCIATINLGFCNGSSNHSLPHGCIESERRALLRFKHDLKDSSNRLASWTSGDGDCCTWAGVLCDNFTGHVLELHLSNPLSVYFLDHASDVDYEAFERSKLVGKINPSLFELKQLIHLDLSYNDFQGIEIPKFFGSMKNLIYLNLSRSEFRGMIPHQIRNLSNLEYLDLNSEPVANYLSVDNLDWLSGLTLLKHLDLSFVNLTQASDWFSVTKTLPSLVVLKLSNCRLNNHHIVLPSANFSSLTTLDLSGNELGNPYIFSWVLSHSPLVFLDLSSNYLSGPIPDGLQNLTSLRHLDLSGNQFNYSKWSQFVYLEYLSLQGNNLQGTIPNDLGNLTSLRVLDLSFNSQLEGRIPRSWGSLCNLNSFSLSSVNLSSQDISEIFDIFLGCIFKKLEMLDLEYCQISGKLTSQLGEFKNLKRLLLAGNSISGHIPSSLGQLSFLIDLDLSHNNLSASIPMSFGKLSSLEYLDFSYNSLSGPVLPIHFESLSKLYFLDASGNSLTINSDPDWVPPFHLMSLSLRSCNLGPHFPSWIFSQKYLRKLDISNSGISDMIPSRFWKSFSTLQFVNLSHNQIYGVIPDLNDVTDYYVRGFSWNLDFSWNNLSGQLPFISIYVPFLDLSNNHFSGSIEYFLCSRKNQLRKMKILNLENNSLIGESPDCWMDWRNLVVLRLNNNKFIGSLPSSMGSLNSLRFLHLGKNCFSGMIPASFKHLTGLSTLDLSENNFFGKVPTWIGERLSGLMILSLRSNKFHGHLPIKLCRLSYIQILDLADNNLHGSIPKCINNFSAMVTIHPSPSNIMIFYLIDGALFFDRSEDATVAMKGEMRKYSTILNLVRSIDLSNNKFIGEIPMEVTELKALQSLNLSHNFFTGKIPENIGAMKSLESIDLSTNQLYGNIPESVSSLNFLDNLNLSNNHLTGRIPSGTQLQTLDASSFINTELCGPPLLTNCAKIVGPPEFENGGSRDGNEHEVDWFYVGMSLGFVMGFWGIIGPLIISRRWRYKYCHFLDFLGYKFGSILRKSF